MEKDYLIPLAPIWEKKKRYPRVNDCVREGLFSGLFFRLLQCWDVPEDLRKKLLWFCTVWSVWRENINNNT